MLTLERVSATNMQRYTFFKYPAIYGKTIKLFTFIIYFRENSRTFAPRKTVLFLNVIACNFVKRLIFKSNTWNG